MLACYIFGVARTPSSKVTYELELMIASPNTTCERKVKVTGKLVEQDPRMSGGGGDAGRWNARCEREAVAVVDCHMSARKIITHGYPRRMQNTK